MKKITYFVLVLSMMFSFALSAKVDTYQFKNEQIEQDYKILIGELRCLVCQNQNLADSNAELAQDMRSKVLKMLNAGNDKDEIVDFMVARYGDFVMYRPPVKTSTFLLWFGPVIFLVIAAFVVVSTLRRQNTKVNIDQEKQQKAHSLLDDNKED